MTSHRWWPVVLAALAAIAGGCGSSSKTATSVSGGSSASSAPLSTATSTPSFVGSTSETSAPGTQATLTVFRHTLQAGAERLIFEFQGGPPGYDVHYVSGHGVLKPSGQLATVGGNAAIQIEFHPAQAHDDQGRPTVTGIQAITINEGSVVDMVLAEDFEGYVNFAVGVTGQPAFHVLTETGPPRIQVDIASTSA